MGFYYLDLLEAGKLLKDETYSGDDKGRVSIYAVKSLLGKAYLYTTQFDLATAKLKDVIDNSGKSLVDLVPTKICLMKE